MGKSWETGGILPGPLRGGCQGVNSTCRGSNMNPIFQKKSSTSQFSNREWNIRMSAAYKLCIVHQRVGNGNWAAWHDWALLHWLSPKLRCYPIRTAQRNNSTLGIHQISSFAAAGEGPCLPLPTTDMQQVRSCSKARFQLGRHSA
jgi:hypothetical protein